MRASNTHVTGRHAWDGPAAWQEKETNARNEGVWMPKPIRGRFMPRRGRQAPDKNPPLRSPGVDGVVEEVAGEAAHPVHLLIVPGPAGLYQIVRLNLRVPVARGFRTKEQARGWIGRAVRAGVLPEGVVEVEPPEQAVGAEDTP